MYYIITRGEDKKQALAGNSTSGKIDGAYWSTDVSRAFEFASPEEAKRTILSPKFSHNIAGMKGSDIVYIEEVASRKIDSTEVAELKIIYEKEKTKLAALMDKKIQLMKELDKVNLEIGRATGG